MKKLTFNAAGLTDVGVQKEINQDSFIFKVADAGEHFVAMAAVADGVGGLQGGERASAAAIANLNRWWQQDFRAYYSNKEDVCKSLLQIFTKTNQEIFSMGVQQEGKMATTLSVLLLYQDTYIVMHVGDSRIYKITGQSGRKVQLLSEDHSLVMEREVEGKIQRRQVLTECLGYKEEFQHSFCNGKLETDDLFLVCSDGVCKTVPGKQLGKIVSQHKGELDVACAELIDAAKKAGESDNITAVLLHAKR